MIATTDAIRDAYSATGASWQAGPARLYDRLAEVLVAHSPVRLDGARVVDVGAGAGAGVRAARLAGAARVIAVDYAPGMVAALRAAQPPYRPDVALLGDATDLPLAAASVHIVLAAFSINHVDDAAAAFAEARRVARPGGAVIAGSYAADDANAATPAVEAALAAHGWENPAWYRALKAHAMAKMATPAACAAAARAGGLDATVVPVQVAFGDLSPVELVEWRLGMANVAPFVAGLAPAERGAVVAEAVTRLAGAPPLVRSILVTVATVVE